MSAVDKWKNVQLGPGGLGALSEPATDGAAVTPSDSTDLTFTSRAIFVGGDGNLVVITLGGTTLTLNGVKGGTILPIRVNRVLATGTTATGIINLW